MSNTVLSKSLAISLLDAMGCPTALCTQVSIDVNMGELAGITIRYNLDPDWLHTAANSLMEASREAPKV
jgi:hypothetical protein